MLNTLDFLINIKDVPTIIGVPMIIGLKNQLKTCVDISNNFPLQTLNNILCIDGKHGPLFVIQIDNSVLCC